MKKKIIVLGLGDNFRVLEKELVKRYNISLIIDKNFTGKFYFSNNKYIPVEKKIPDKYKNKKLSILITIADINTRFKNVKFLKLKFKNAKFISFISNKAKIIGKSKINDGSIIFPYTLINSNSVIGEFVIINNSCHIQHDNCISNFVNINPKVVTGGNVFIGKKTTIGINSTLRNNINIGENSFVGMGSIISEDIPKNTMIYFKSKKTKKLLKFTD